MSNIRAKLAGKTSKLAQRAEKIKDHPADPNYYESGGFYNVEVDLIVPNPDQPRKFFDPNALKELSQSIKQNGVLQPVIIRIDEDGQVLLVAGERRYRAAKMAGLEKIPAIITTGKPAEIALIENLQREDLKPIEEAEALEKVIKDYNYTQEVLARIVGKAKSTISETLSLNKLPEEIKEEVRRAELFPRRLLVEIAKQETSESMVKLFNRIKKDNLKSESVRDLTRKRETTITKTPGLIAIEKATGLTNYLSKIDLEFLDSKEREQLITELDNLKKVLNKILKHH